MSEPTPLEAKHILIHIVAPVSGSMLAYGMLFDEGYTIPEATLLFLGACALLFYAFSNTIDIANERLNGHNTGKID